jgi:two-component system, LytTR family, response regulator LytT
MQAQIKKSELVLNGYAVDGNGGHSNQYAVMPFSSQEMATVFEKIDAFKNFFLQGRPFNLNDLLSKIATPAGKKSFLVFKQHKYITVPTENIAYFYIKYDSSVLVCFDRQEYSVNYSLEQIQQLLAERQFFRLNRQYLINFDAVKEVEHYFARKLLVNLTVATPEKLLVAKEKVRTFLNWLESR